MSVSAHARRSRAGNVHIKDTVGLVWTIALQQMLARKRQAVIIITGVVMGVTVLLVTISLFDGLLASFTAKILDVAPHVTMKADRAEGGRSDLLAVPDGDAQAAVQLDRSGEREERVHVRNIMSVLRSVERTMGDQVRAASPYLATQVLAAYGTNESTLSIVGVLPEREADLSNLPRYLLSGSIARLEASRDGMLIGVKAAEDLGVDVGDRMQLVSLSGEVIPVMIVGVYRMGVEATDRSAFVNLRLAQALDRALPGEASGIGFQLRSVADADIVAQRIESLTGFTTETWQETNAGIISIFRFLQALFYVVVGFVIVICGFGVANILITTVMEKQRDIAVMKSFGVGTGTIIGVYLIEGLLIGAIGSVVGSLVGAGAIALMGMIPSGGTGGVAPIESKTLQMGFAPWYFAAAIAGTLFVSMAAAIAPARTAARVAPARILRGER